MAINKDYDYWNAILSGMSPDMGKWGSRIQEGKNKGLILKSMEHPTILSTLIDELDKGYIYWYKDPEERRMYTFNKVQEVFQRMNADKFGNK